MLAAFDLQRLAPQSNEKDFASWWGKATRRVAKEQRKGLSTLIILGAWTIWKHRNAGLFDGASPNIQIAISNLRLEAQLWTFAGATKLQQLGLGRLLSLE